MPNPNSQQPVDNYDPRWFIWTIVFLLVSGISLVSYILLSDTASPNDAIMLVHNSKSAKNK